MIQIIRRLFIPCLWLILVPGAFLGARDFFIEDRGHFIGVPDDWDIIDITDTKFTFADQSESVFLIMRYYDADQFDSAEELYDGVLDNLGAGGEGSGYTYAGIESFLGDLQFSAGDFGFSGFAVCLDHQEYDLALLAFGDNRDREYFMPFMLSALDSFAPDEAALRLPGPISQYLSPFPDEDRQLTEVGIDDEHFRLRFSETGLQTAADLINREAVLLSNYGDGVTNEAWIRYYNVIFRDNYQRLESYAAALSRHLGLRGLDNREVAEKVLAWIQRFQYERPDNLADLISPAEAAFRSTGDCDARVLLYTILLHHYGIPAIMLVSVNYAHAIAGVDVEGPGARYPMEDGRTFVTAETTEDVDMGLIAADMADPAGWVAVEFK